MNSWTQWPETQGQQFVRLGKDTWVANVIICFDWSTEAGHRVTIWKGSSYYTLYSKKGNKGFSFHKLIWPENT
jgi:hypothetical protein